MIDESALAFMCVAALTFVNAAAICDATGAPLDLLADVVGKLVLQMPPGFKDYAAIIAAGSYESPNLPLASGAAVDEGESAGRTPVAQLACRGREA